MTTNWHSLQNGSDIRGVALSGVPGEDINLTPDVVGRLAISFCRWLSDTIGKPTSELRLAVGMDSRLSGPTLKDAFAAAAANLGADVGDAGIASTPAMFMSTILPGFEFDGAVMLTASHLPFNRNGLKFFTKDGGLNKGDISSILALAAGDKPAPPADAPKGTVQVIPLIESYAAGIVDLVRTKVGDEDNAELPLRGLRILVDAGNGAGGFFAQQVLEPLGADTTGSQFLDPDGRFPNHEPNPENKEAMASLVSAVNEHDADFGIIFDTDVDRSSAVDAGGIQLNRNRLIGLIAAILLEEHPGTTIVTDSITSSGLTTFIENKLNGTHHRFKRGYKNVINEAQRLNDEGQDAQIAIETSGHAAFKENHYLDDGSYLVTRLLIKLAQLKRAGKGHLSDLIRDLPEPQESEEFRIRILSDDFRSTGQAVLDGLETAVSETPGWELAPNNYEGVRVNCGPDHGDGWFLLRLSLHDPVLPLNIESNQAGGVALMAEAVHALLQGNSDLDLGALQAATAVPGKQAIGDS